MAKKKILLSCHDCENEIKIILDEYADLEMDDVKHCPLCGCSDNISVE